MVADYNDELKLTLSEGFPYRHFHKMGIKQWSYNNCLADIADIKRHSLAVENLYNFVTIERKFKVTQYKSDSYTLTGPESFRKIEP